MPSYAWLMDASWSDEDVTASIDALSALGHPYTLSVREDPAKFAHEQADAIHARLSESGLDVPADREIIAIVAYLQRLGKDGTAALAAAAQRPAPTEAP